MWCSRILVLAVLGVVVAGGAGTAAGHDGACAQTAATLPTLTVTLGAPPTTVLAGRQTPVPVSVQRLGTPAAGIAVQVRLQHGSRSAPATYAQGETDAAGQITLLVAVPAAARGPLSVSAYAGSTVVELPCHQHVEERGSADSAWGRAVG